MLVPAPEILSTIDTYLAMDMDIDKTAKALNMDRQALSVMIHSAPAQAYLTGLFYDSGYRNRDRMFKMMESLIDKKLEEMEESEMGSSKDIIEIMQAFHKMKMDELKLELKKQELEMKAAAINKPTAPGVAIQINDASGNPQSSAAWANVLNKIVQRGVK